MPPAVASPSFWQKSNDLRCRDWPCRVTRFLRARLGQACRAGLLLADDPRVLQAWRHGWDTDHYLRLRRWHDHGFRPDVVFDIGAHDGLWSEMCEAVLSPRQIVLFEPQRDHREKALGRAHGAARHWQVLPVALGEQEGTAVMHVTRNTAAASLLPPLTGNIPGEWGTAEVREETVPVETLDGLAAQGRLPDPGLIKIDVQGYEAQVLAGGPRLVARAERIIVEVSLRAMYDRQPLLPEVLHTLAGWGFVLDDVSDACREWGGTLWQADLWLKRST